MLHEMESFVLTETMRFYGPAVMFDTRRFEAKHRVMKEYNS